MARASKVYYSTPRSNVWFGMGLAGTVIASSATLLLTLNAAALALRPFTVIRTRLAIMFGSDQLVANEGSNGVLSFQVVTEAAAAAGVASIPTPLTETNADFFVYKPVAFDFLLNTAVGFNEHRGDAAYHTVDSKAMRKVGQNDDIAVVIQQRVATGAIVGIEGRMLVKLH